MTLARDTERIESERLTLRRISRDDLAFFTRIHAIPIVAQYLGHGRPRSPEESSAWLESILSTYEQFELGPLAVLRKSDGMLIGRVGLSDLAVESGHAIGAVPRAWFQRAQIPDGTQLIFERELGYTFDPQSWGHGYASEAVRCVFDYVRDVLRLPRMVSVIIPGNVRSLRIAEKFGLQRDGSTEIMERVCDRYVWPMA